jgi:hypothetical protein
LCEEPDLSYGRAKEICQAHEGAEKSLENFQHTTKGQAQGEINFINKRSKWKEQNWKTGKNRERFA